MTVVVRMGRARGRHVVTRWHRHAGRPACEHGLWQMSAGAVLACGDVPGARHTLTTGSANLYLSVRFPAASGPITCKTALRREPAFPMIASVVH